MRIVIKLVWDFLKLLCNSLRWIIFSLPFLTFILVTVLMASFSIWALVSAIYIPHSPWTRSQPTSTRMVAWEMQARSLWIIASTILVLGLLVSICIGVRSMWIALQHRKRWWFPSYFVCTTVFTIAVFVFGALCNWCWGPSNVVFWPGIELAPGWKVGDVYHLHLIFGCCGAIFLIAGCIALYHFSDRPALVLSLHDICERLRWLDNSLYAGAFLMIGAALSHHAVALWQASLIKDDESAAVYMQFGKSFTTTVGVYYGLVVAAVYASVLIPLSLRGKHIARLIAKSGKEANELLETYGIQHSVSVVISRVAACLGPAIAGSIAEILR